MRALVAAALQPFLEAERVPADLDVTLLAENAEVPELACDGVLPHVRRRIGAAEMDRLRGLRVIANFGVGYDNIDVAAATERGIAVANTPDVLTGATAELTWALILAAARRLGEGERLVRAGAWTGWTPTQLLGMSLDGATLGIVGAGRIGREVGRRAGAFGARPAYWSRSRHASWETETGARFLELDDLLAQSDVVTLHAALNAETRGLLSARRIAAMKRGAILINTARGGLVDEAALAGALASGHLRAAGLDVYAGEPAVPAALRTLENVVLLPHLGSATEQARAGMWRVAWTNLLAGMRGEPLLNPV